MAWYACDGRTLVERFLSPGACKGIFFPSVLPQSLPGNPQISIFSVLDTIPATEPDIRRQLGRQGDRVILAKSSRITMTREDKLITVIGGTGE